MRSNRENSYQWTLIACCIVITALLGYFLLRELFPEYKIYQNRYVELEQIRSSQTGVPPAPFKQAIKQLVMTPADGGPEAIDRCTSCHVALKLNHFSSTRIRHDLNGNVVRDANGSPVVEKNPDYIWDSLSSEQLEALQGVEVGHHHYDVKKVLSMHPLIGRETRPFEYHAMEEYGCTVCHGGNGRGLVTDRSHGPIFDEQYHAEAHGPTPVFLESDPENDPKFASVFNHKPGHRLLFQTKPILVGSLMQARCAQCHKTSQADLEGIATAVDVVVNRKQRQIAEITDGITQDVEAFSSLAKTKTLVKQKGTDGAISELSSQLEDFRLTPDEIAQVSSQITYLESASTDDKELVGSLESEMERLVGSPQLTREAEMAIASGGSLRQFLDQNKERQQATGAIFAKLRNRKLYETAVLRVSEVKTPLLSMAQDRTQREQIAASQSGMIHSYERGEKLFFSQACYACHKISGITRGGVGPELTEIGLVYPWYVKESIVWPQGNLKTSTMPNFKLDHEEVEDLLTFLMAQQGDSKTSSKVDRIATLKAWEAGAKMPWEKAVPPSEIKDIKKSKIIFATQGCASCHRLKGFESDIGLALEKQNSSFERLLEEKEWFQKLFPIQILGSQIVKTIQENKEQLERRIVSDVRSDGVIEMINEVVPEGVEAHYTPFKFAKRARNAEFAEARQNASTQAQIDAIDQQEKEWKELVNKVLMVYIQEYGFGRDIGPRLHWSGIYRDDEWLVQHFRNPAAHSAKSIMPVLPFDDSKFYALTYMLQELGKQNRDDVRKIWELRGFDAQMAYDMHCASCHGDYMHGNGPVAEWIYPIPKNLRNATFLRNLTRERAIYSIVHGVRGGPMPPWGEAPSGRIFGGVGGDPVMTKGEIEQLVDWLFLALPGGRVIEKDQDVDKWQYTPEDVLEELREEGGTLQSEGTDWPREKTVSLNDLPSGKGYYASLSPSVRLGSQVGDLFEVRPLAGNPEAKGYYIQPKYYTTENLRIGQHLFVTNCAHCHGKEGGGNGERAGTMNDAKPRMLTNLPWLESRDDLRLIRSIKFGVAGTSMTPWGDKTNALQRMQLVMFIRQLTTERKSRDRLNSILYHSYERAEQTVQEARSAEFKEVARLKAKLKEVRDRREQLYITVKSGESSSSEAADVYRTELALVDELHKREDQDSRLARIQQTIEEEKQIYRSLGMGMLAKRADPFFINKLFDLLQVNRMNYLNQGSRLVLERPDQGPVESIEKEIVAALDAKITELRHRNKAALGQLPSAERDQTLTGIKEKLTSALSLKRDFVSSMERVSQGRRTQKLVLEGLDRYSSAL